MLPEDFANMIIEFKDKEDNIMEWKKGEYSTRTDRLQNFKEVGAFMGITPREVALLYMMKHIQSIAVAIKTGRYDWAWETEDGEAIKQRIADARNYLLLLAACLQEENKEDNTWI